MGRRVGAGPGPASVPHARRLNDGADEAGGKYATKLRLALCQDCLDLIITRQGTAMTDGAEGVYRLPLLSQMAEDMETRGSLCRSTAAAMWSAYVTHTAVTAWTLGRRADRLPVPPGVARVAGAALATAGAGLCIAGMGRFSGVAELTGTRSETLLTNGIYQYSRNPQYLGYLVALTGAGLARRSVGAIISTAGLGLVYSAWIPVEERHLTGLYGQEYTGYTRRTLRWWGRRQ